MDKSHSYKLDIISRFVSVDYYGLTPVAKFQFNQVSNVSLYVEVWSSIPDRLYSQMVYLQRKREEGCLIDVHSCHVVHDIHIHNAICDVSKLIIYKASLKFISYIKIDDAIY